MILHVKWFPVGGSTPQIDLIAGVKKFKIREARRKGEDRVRLKYKTKEGWKTYDFFPGTEVRVQTDKPNGTKTTDYDMKKAVDEVRARTVDSR